MHDDDKRKLYLEYRNGMRALMELRLHELEQSVQNSLELCTCDPYMEVIRSLEKHARLEAESALEIFNTRNETCEEAIRDLKEDIEVLEHRCQSIWDVQLACAAQGHNQEEEWAFTYCIDADSEMGARRMLLENAWDVIRKQTTHPHILFRPDYRTDAVSVCNDGYRLQCVLSLSDYPEPDELLTGLRSLDGYQEDVKL